MTKLKWDVIIQSNCHCFLQQAESQRNQQQMLQSKECCIRIFEIICAWCQNDSSQGGQGAACLCNWESIHLLRDMSIHTTTTRAEVANCINVVEQWSSTCLRPSFSCHACNSQACVSDNAVSTFLQILFMIVDCHWGFQSVAHHPDETLFVAQLFFCRLFLLVIFQPSEIGPIACQNSSNH